MVILIFHNQLFEFEDRITDLPIDDSLETRWLRASHDTYQNQTRTGLHENVPRRQDIGVVAVQTIQDTRAADTSGVPSYLKRKPLVRHDGMSFNGIRKES